MHIPIKKLHHDAQPPRYATHDAAAFDLVALEGAEIPPMFAATIRTGLAFEVPPGYAMQILSRSGHGFKHGVRLSNAVGLIDPDYRGEVMVRLHNDGDAPFTVEAGDRVAQAMIVQAPRVTFAWADDLSSTTRGDGGFGSTGTK